MKKGPLFLQEGATILNVCSPNHFKIHEANTDGTLMEKRNKQKYICSLRFQHFSFIHLQNKYAKTY